MGGRQIIAVFLTEAVSAIFDEIKDACKNTRNLGGNWIAVLKSRIKRILKRIISKWRDALQSGLTGTISGFFSNILTVLINIFVTTAKNIVRIIREGFFSLVGAVTYLVNPPEGFSAGRRFHEAGKIIISGAVVTLGIVTEETINTFPPMFAIRAIPFAGEMIADVLYGVLVALVTCLSLWAWDKVDIFGVKAERRHEFVMQELQKERAEDDQPYLLWLERIRLQDEERYERLRTETFGPPAA
jgi:hypothetical protein